MHGHVDDANLTSSALEGLTEEQTERLTDLLDRYLAGLEAGEPLAMERLLEGNPDLNEPLRLYLDKLNELHNFSAGFSPHLAGVSVSASFRSRSSPRSSNITRRDSPLPTPVNQAADATIGERGDAGHGSDASDNAAVPLELLEGDWHLGGEGPAGRRLGDFELLRVVGRGGMGIVYEARQVSLQRKVALKLLPLTSLLDSRQIARFKNEAQAAAALQHPNIVPVYAVGSCQGIHYYAMRLIDGQPLDAIIAALRIKRFREQDPHDLESLGSDDLPAAEGWHVPTDMRRVIRLGIQAASALAAAHDEGIVHRDIKPSNLLIDKAGKLWVTDFGLARRANDHSLTATGDVLGTLRYMSPEQASGRAGMVDARSDIYSLGVTLYELLTLAPAVVGESSPGLLRAIEQSEPVALKHVRPDVPRDLVTVLETAMAKNPYERYPTVQQFADDLLRVLEGRPTLAKPPTMITRTTRWAVRHYRLVAAALLIFVFAFTSLGACAWIMAYNSAIAQANAESAENMSSTLRDSMERLYLQKAEELKDVPGAEPVRRGLLIDLIGYYSQLVSELRDDHRFRADFAKAMSRLGALHRDLGDTTAAREELHEAHSLLSNLVASDRSNSEYQRELAVCANELSRVLSQLGMTREAEARAREAVSLQEALVQARDGDANQIAELAEARNNLALLLADIGKRDEAERLLTAARVQLVELASQNPRHLKYQKLLAATYNNLCSVIGGRDPEAAVKLYELSLDVQQEVLKGARKSMLPGAQMGVTYSNLGKSLVHSGQLAQAIDAYQHAIAIQRQLVAVAPSQQAYVRDLGISLNNLGLAQMKQGQLKESEASFREAIRWQHDVIANAPKDANAAHDLGGTYNNLATLLQSFPDMQAIDAAFEQAIFFQRQAQQSAPAVEKYREFLDNHLRNYSTWLRNSRREEQALAAMLERRILWSKHARKLVLVASDLADAALDLAEDNNRQGVAQRYADAAMETLELAQRAGLTQSHGLTVQQLLSQQPFSSLAQIKSPTD